jgi:hypothetical protein
MEKRNHLVRNRAQFLTGASSFLQRWLSGVAKGRTRRSNRAPGRTIVPDLKLKHIRFYVMDIR